MSSLTAAEKAPVAARRSVTVPTKLVNPSATRREHQAAGDGIETLYTHPAVRIVSFTTPANTSRPSSSSSFSTTDSEHGLAGLYPWTSPTERTTAAGPLRIYRVPGSVSFLNTGSYLKPILPKSQCWCVDGESKFVFRIRIDSFCRIELPYVTEEDKAKVEELKTVFAQILQYETTPCPFQRGFHVELPMPRTPVRRKTWRNSEKARKWKLDKVWTPEGTPQGTPEGEEPPSRTGSDGSSQEPSDDDTISVSSGRTIEDQENTPPPSSTMHREVAPRPVRPSVRAIAASFRSVTAPPQILPLTSTSPNTQHNEPPSPPRFVEEQRTKSEDSLSITSTIDTFYTAESRSPSLPPSPPSSSHGDHTGHPEPTASATDNEPKSHRRNLSEITVTSYTPSLSDAELRTPVAATHPPDLELPSPTTPTLMSDSDDSFEPPISEIATPPGTEAIRLRRLGPSGRRALSPLPPAANLFTPQKQNQQLTRMIVEKTCAIFLGPPAHLVQLMLRIAARFTNGARLHMNPYFSKGGRGRLPGSWDSDEEEDDPEGEEGDDDYGIPLKTTKGVEVRRRLDPSRADDEEIE